jgi:archaemetzincin
MRTKEKGHFEKILIVPIGTIEQDILDHIRSVLEETFQREAIVDEPLKIPQQAYNVRRKQYHSTRILKVLAAMKPASCEFLLGVIDEDCYVPGLNFVFGEADLLSRAAVIALPRLRQDFYGYDPERDLLLLRAAKEAIHELGHTCGFGHCPDPRCVMHFSNNLGDTDVKTKKFCDACRNMEVSQRVMRTKPGQGNRGEP